MRSIVFLTLLAFISVASGFKTASMPKFSMKSRTSFANSQSLKMSEESEVKYDLVPVDKTNIESAASFTGAILGLVIAGPVGGLFLAAIVNYVSKKDNEAGEALRGIGKTIVESVNFFKKVDSKYTVTGAVTESVTSLTSQVAAENESIEKVTTTLSTAVAKVQELDKEYDLLGKGKEVIGAAGTFSDAALEKIDELNQKVCSYFTLVFP